MKNQKSLIRHLLLLGLIVSNLNSADFNILFTANINGSLENCKCGKIPLGGIARIKSFIDAIAAKNAQCLVVDGGDFFNSYPFFELNQAMLKSIELLKYDLFLPGDQEFVEGIKFYNLLIERLKPNLLLSNLENQKNIKRSFKFNTIKVDIYGFLSPKSFEFITKPKKLSLLPFSSLQNVIDTSVCNIVVFHGPIQEAEKCAQEYKWIDLILLAHDQQLDPKQVFNTIIIGCGQDSEYITVIAVEKLNDRWHFDINQEPVGPSIPEDKSITQIINSYHEKQKSNLKQ